MEQKIQFVTAPDGVRLAVATTGSGRGEGAGLWASSADNLRITSNEIYSNTGNDNGGGIHVRASYNIQINDNVVHNNVDAIWLSFQWT